MILRNKKIEYCYIHIPFCKTICNYCDFTHVIKNKDLVKDWLNALQMEIEGKKIHPFLKTLYLGGGTPSCLDVEDLEHLFKLLQPYSKYVEEYTIEVNPESFTKEKAKLFSRYGINRVSIGYQTSIPSLLKSLGRKHTAMEVLDTMQLLRNEGIDNISLDLMYSIPEQRLEDLKESVDQALSFHPKHLSLYSLTIEENTVFGKKGIQPLEEEVEANMYSFICDYLPRYGYNQYEVSNFALANKESLHNKAYWEYEDFYGLSCGASGKEKEIRYDKPRSLKEYIENPHARNEIVLSEYDQQFEMIMMGLRMKKGISKEAFLERFGLCIEEAFHE
ncbi:MAG: radical SAM family heme chaperone HemW, partial [Solobacterium sp.]|nr:radical SAM family heme chaperone HemW [Solobacterium sp.]